MTRASKRGTQAPAERVTRSRPQKPHAAVMPQTPTTPRRSGRRAPPPAGSDAAAAPVAAPSDTIRINRAPVLTLWAAAVAERAGHPWEAALTFGQRIAAMFAQSKGRSLGVFEASEETPEHEARRARERAGTFPVPVFGTSVLARHDPSPAGGGRALAASGAGVASPSAAASYLRRAFGERLPDATAALKRLAAAVPADELAQPHVAYRLYCRIRPQVPLGVAGWGARGAFDLAAVRALAEHLEKGGTAAAEGSEGGGAAE